MLQVWRRFGSELEITISSVFSCEMKSDSRQNHHIGSQDDAEYSCGGSETEISTKHAY